MYAKEVVQLQKALCETIVEPDILYQRYIFEPFYTKQLFCYYEDDAFHVVWSRDDWKVTFFDRTARSNRIAVKKVSDLLGYEYKYTDKIT